MKYMLVTVIAALFLAAFVGVWLWIAYEFWQFEPASSTDALDLENKLVEVAGFLAATVAAGTAAFLGIEIQKRPGISLRGLYDADKARAALLAAGVLAYLLIGTVIFTLWLTEPEPTPEFIGAFAWGVLGWAAGAFTAVFAATEPNSSGGGGGGGGGGGVTTPR